MSNARDDWANYRNFINHRNALDLIFRYAPPRVDFVEHFYGKANGPLRNADVTYDIERAADEEGVSVTDYLRGPSCSGL